MLSTRKDPVVFEVTTTLKEWHKIWISLYLDNQTDLFEQVGATLDLLIDARAELLLLLNQNNHTNNNNINSNNINTLSQDATGREQQIVVLKNYIINQLDAGNRLLGLDLVPRDASFKLVDPVELSPLRLYQIHAEALSKATATIPTQSATPKYTVDNQDNNSTSNPANLITYHLQLTLKNHCLASLPPDELVEVYFSIVDSYNNNPTTTIKTLTDKFIVQIKNDELACGVPSTIFTNLGPLLKRDIYLYVQVYRLGKMTLVDGSKTTFGRQSTGQNQPNTSQDGSNGSINSASYTPNGLARSNQSSIGLFNSQQRYKRPFGTAVILLKEYAKNPSFIETNLSVKVMSSPEAGFSQFNDIYSKRNHALKNNQNLANIQLDMAFRFISCSQNSLTRSTTLSSFCLTEKKGFPDVVMPGDFKNDLYFTLENAEFEKGGKSISKNIEASVSLIDKAGIVIDNCISPGSNCDNISCYKSCVYYHSNSPKWNETIKINVPLTEFDSAHIRIEFRHCSTKERERKFLGFSFLPLSDEIGTVIADHSHELYLYKCDSQLWEDESLNLCKYTSLPYGPAVDNQSKARPTQQPSFTHSSRELVTVSTFLLSTKLTQNSNLLNLLKWRELIKRDNKDFEEALKKVLIIKGEEIVKFLQDILDTLFDTFTLYSTSEDDKSALIFKVLVHIFLILDEPKYQHFKPVLDTYASAHFSATLVHRGLLVCVKKCLEYSANVERHVPIQKCFKSIKYVFQFIVQSKLLYSKATGEHSDEHFLNDLRHLFKQFEPMLADNNPNLIPIQVTFLESFPGALEQLIKVMSPQELARVIITLAGSVGFRLPPALSKAKLIFMRETAKCELIKNQEVRLQVTENFCRHLLCYIRNSEELDLCYEVLEILIIKIHDYHWPSIYRLHQLIVKTTEPCIMTVGEINLLTKRRQIQADQLDLALISVSKEIEPFVLLIGPLLHRLDVMMKDLSKEQPNHHQQQVLVQKYYACFLTILKLMSQASFEYFNKRRNMDYFPLCILFKSFGGIYNREWSVMQLASHSILEHPINEIFKDIKSKSDGTHSVTRQLSSYIKLIVDYITHPTLQLEAFSERKKNYVMNVFGDLRLKFSAHLIQFWKDLTLENRTELIPTSVQSFLDVSLLPNNELQHMLIPVFYDMMDAEERLKSSTEDCVKTRQFECCFMDNIDILMNLDRGDHRFITNFSCILENKIKKNSTNCDRGLKLVSSFTKLMQLLLSYRESIEICGNRTRQMTCLVELLNFYRDQGRSDLHPRYLFKLCDMHLELGNHVEAAMVLKLYADELQWRNRNLIPLGGYCKEEQEWKRKEILYQRIIHYFDLGKCWEEAISFCKELASFYENFLVDYEKVSNTLRKLAQFLDNILTEHRPEREYFRVEYIGSDLPEFVKGKEFIYRGGEYERLAAFMQRMITEFPEAKILNFKSKQTVTRDSPGQFMVISNVKPVPFHEHLKTQRNINDKIIQYYLNNRLDTFSYDVPIIKNNPAVVAQDKSSEHNVRNLWVGRHTLKLKKQLPDILPWAEVVSHEYNEIEPIDHAIETISNMNVELVKLIESYTSEPFKQISPLTMRLQGVIEAAVNGGPAVFINAFLKIDSCGTTHQHDQKSSILRDLIRQQFLILKRCLHLHSKLAPPEVMPLHARLIELRDTAHAEFESVVKGL